MEQAMADPQEETYFYFDNDLGWETDSRPIANINIREGTMANLEHVEIAMTADPAEVLKNTDPTIDFSYNLVNTKLVHEIAILERQEATLYTEKQHWTDEMSMYHTRMRKYLRNKKEYFAWLRVQRLDQPLRSQIESLIKSTRTLSHFNPDTFMNRHESYKRMLNSANLQQAKRNWQQLEVKIATRKQAVAALKMLPEAREIKFNRKELIKSINRIDGFKSTEIKATSNTLALTIRAGNIAVEPSEGEENKAQTLAGQEDVSFTLKDFSFTLTLTTTEENYLVAFNCIEKFRGYSGHMIVHPHWLNNDSFCFGDFQNSYSTCMNAFDPISALCILRSALANYNPSDEAGISFTSWLGLDTPEPDDEPDSDWCHECDNSIDNCTCDICSDCEEHYDNCQCE